MTFRFSALALLAALPLAGCMHAVAPAPPARATADAPAHDNLNAMLWMQRSVEYRALCEQTYRAAARQLDRALADARWDALIPADRLRPVDGLPPAVVMDIDETVLDNSPYQARMVIGDLSYTPDTWDAWVRERKATAIPGVVEFAKAAQARGITVIYLSNRPDYLQADTLANLRAVGMPVASDDVFLGLGTKVERCTQEGSEKDCRRRLVSQRYRVLMQFGDQMGDFLRVDPETYAARDALWQAHDGWVGERWWVIANPSYGAWETGRLAPAAEGAKPTRRQNKRASLNLAN